ADHVADENRDDADLEVEQGENGVVDDRAGDGCAESEEAGGNERRGAAWRLGVRFDRVAAASAECPPVDVVVLGGDSLPARRADPRRRSGCGGRASLRHDAVELELLAVDPRLIVGHLISSAEASAGLRKYRGGGSFRTRDCLEIDIRSSPMIRVDKRRLQHPLTASRRSRLSAGWALLVLTGVPTPPFTGA